MFPCRSDSWMIGVPRVIGRRAVDPIVGSIHREAEAKLRADVAVPRPDATAELQREAGGQLDLHEPASRGGEPGLAEVAGDVAVDGVGRLYVRAEVKAPETRGEHGGFDAVSNERQRVVEGEVDEELQPEESMREAAARQTRSSAVSLLETEQHSFETERPSTPIQGCTFELREVAFRGVDHRAVGPFGELGLERERGGIESQCPSFV